MVLETLLDVPTFVLIINLVVAVLVYIDAKNHAEKYPLLWALVVFLAPLIGLLLYILLAREA